MKLYKAVYTFSKRTANANVHCYHSANVHCYHS